MITLRSAPSISLILLVNRFGATHLNREISPTISFTFTFA